MVFRKAEKDDFEKIKSLYCTLIDREQNDPSFPHWKKGIHPSDEMIRKSIDKEELYVLTDCSVCDSKWRKGRWIFRCAMEN